MPREVLFLNAASGLGTDGNNGVLLRFADQPHFNETLARLGDAGHVLAVVLPGNRGTSRTVAGTRLTKSCRRMPYS